MRTDLTTLTDQELLDRLDILVSEIELFDRLLEDVYKEISKRELNKESLK